MVLAFQVGRWILRARTAEGPDLVFFSFADSFQLLPFVHQIHLKALLLAIFPSPFIHLFDEICRIQPSRINLTNDGHQKPQFSTFLFEPQHFLHFLSFLRHCFPLPSTM